LAKPLNGLFGDTSELRLMHSLLPLKGVEFNITDLQAVTGLTRPVLTRVVKKFASWSIMQVAYKHGNANFYELNANSPFVILFQRLSGKVMEHMLEEDVLADLQEHRQKRRKMETTSAIGHVAIPTFSRHEWVSISPGTRSRDYLTQATEAPQFTAESAPEGVENANRAS
jgi:hypothetical protein